MVKDLAVDMAAFFDKWTAARGFFEPGDAIPDDFAVVTPESDARRAADEGIECIGCGICHSACDVVAWDAAYLGPAALNRAWTLVNDVRDRAQGVRLDAVAGRSGCHACHTHMSCTTYLPQGDRADLFHRRVEARGGEARALRRRSMTATLFLLQRASAGVLALAVAVHLATIVYAVRGGLTAGEILARTEGNAAYLAFYVVFVLAVAVHAPIGLRNVLREWLGWQGTSLRRRACGVRVRAARARRSRGRGAVPRMTGGPRTAAGLCRGVAAPPFRHRARDLRAGSISSRWPRC